jgi:hypothetical protein
MRLQGSPWVGRSVPAERGESRVRPGVVHWPSLKYTPEGLSQLDFARKKYGRKKQMFLCAQAVGTLRADPSHVLPDGRPDAGRAALRAALCFACALPDDVQFRLFFLFLFLLFLRFMSRNHLAC